MINNHFKKCFVVTLLIVLSALHSYSQGPTSPEAVSFEPVDAPDMVNLKTGDMTYTIPIINIPGPGGGYPLALAYHAGISTDQESSWVGLGWSLNPGAINRSVNRLPDDWKEAKIYDYYWDKGETKVQHTIDVSVPLLPALSIGLGVSWGSLRGFGGSISASIHRGPSVTLGDNGISVGVGISKTPFSISVGIDPMNDSYSLNAGLQTGSTGLNGAMNIGVNNKSGVYGSASIGYGSKGSTSLSGRIGLTSSGALTYSTGASRGVYDSEGHKMPFSYNVGTGGALYTTTAHQKDLTIESSGYSIPLIVINYTKEKLKVYLDKNKTQFATGSLYKASTDVDELKLTYCEKWASNNILSLAKFEYDNCLRSNPESSCDYEKILDQTTLMYYNTYFNACKSDPEDNGFEYYGKDDHYQDDMIWPTVAATEYDLYNVTGQGMNGMMSPSVEGIANPYSYDSGDLVDFGLTYFDYNDQVDRSKKVEFSFRSDFNHKMKTNPIDFIDSETNPNPVSLESIFRNPSSIISRDEIKGKYTEYFTYEDLEDNRDVKLPDDFEKPDNVGNESIAGFVITSTDGMKYYYMLPVYNHLYKTRKNRYHNKPRDAYSESTKAPYATHWLLTAVTGPDYFDKNGNKKVDKEDYGYWVNFDYGKWSDGMVWRNPADLSKDHTAKAFTYMWGIKDLYYLDKVNTSTHTALFIKNLREDAKGIPVSYIDKNASHDKILPTQKQLLLDKIVLLKNEDVSGVTKINTSDIDASGIHQFYDPRSEFNHTLNLSLQNNVLDIKDKGIDQSLIEKSMSVIDFEYDYSLAPNSVNTDAEGKLTLKKIYTKGVGGENLVPPYEFLYENNPSWEHFVKNTWGYNHENPSAWSLTGIELPIGGKINIAYEADTYTSLSAQDEGAVLDFKPLLYFPTENSLKVKMNTGSYAIETGAVFKMSYLLYDYKCTETSAYANVTNHPCNSGKCTWVRRGDFNGLARYLGDGYFEAIIDSGSYFYTEGYEPQNPGGCTDYNRETASFREGGAYKTAGIRVKQLSFGDDVHTWNTTYDYKTGDVPYEPTYDKNIRNQFFLGSPIVLYPEVKVTKYDALGIKESHSIYEYTTHKTETCQGESYDCNKLNKKYLSYSSWGDKLGYNYIAARKTEINDYQSSVGLLKSVSHYDNSNRLVLKEENEYDIVDNDHINSDFISKEAYQLFLSTDNTYREDEEDGDQGVPGGTKKANFISTIVNRYPTILKSKKTTSGPFESITTYGDYDPYTGNSNSTIVENSDGINIKTETIKAYQKYPGMGSKQVSINNANMLDQEAASYTWKKNMNTNQYELLSTSVQTWHNQWMYRDYKGDEFLGNAWRKHKVYAWKGTGVGLNSNGTVEDVTGATSFNWWNNQEPSSNSGWLKGSEIKSYNKYSGVIEQLDVNGLSASQKYSIDDTKTIAVANTKYQNFYFTDFEDYNVALDGLSGELNSIQGNSISNEYHTGAKSLFLSSSWIAISNGLFESGKYKVTVWYKGSGVLKLNNQNPEVSVSAGEWKLNHYYINLNTGDNITVTGNGYIDDFRMHPLKAVSMKSFVYDNRDRLTYAIGTNGFSTHYKYNSNGDLIEVWGEVSDKPGVTGGFKKASEHRRNYKKLN